ncbi:MAG: DNA-3-methyladenine glycosylase I [Phycisphaerales bacterium JB037]
MSGARTKAAGLARCGWCGDDPVYVAYHDEEWGVPVRDEQRLFEMLCLEGAQAGLSWITVLRKRARYREVFGGFDPEWIVRHVPGRVEELLGDPGIIRNRLKVESVVKNAQAWLAMRERGESPGEHLWSFVGGEPVVNRFRSLAEVPAKTAASDAMSKDLKKRGFGFVGSTICYAFMQACGLVNDHVVGCWRHPEAARRARSR